MGFDYVYPNRSLLGALQDGLQSQMQKLPVAPTVHSLTSITENYRLIQLKSPVVLLGFPVTLHGMKY